MRTLQSNLNRLEGLVLVQQERMNTALAAIASDAAKQSDVLDECKSVLAKVLQARDKWMTDVSIIASQSPSGPAFPSWTSPPQSAASVMDLHREIAGIKKRLHGAHELQFGNFTLVQQVGAFARLTHSKVQEDSKILSELRSKVEALSQRHIPAEDTLDGGIAATLPVLSLEDLVPAAGGVASDARSSASSDLVMVSAL
eukprot:3338833-Amphidinium_carterae.2